MSSPPLTKRQREILDFFQAYVRTNAISPTLEEIAQAFGVNRVTIFGHVAELERKGILKRSARRISRGLELSSAARAEQRTVAPTRVQIIGQIAAGSPMEPVETPEALDLTELLPPGGDVYALRVRGDSMIDDAIQDGDLVLVENRRKAHDGEIVVAILPDQQEATLKRLYRHKDGFRLQPANSTMRPRIVPDVEIRGVVLGVIRRY